MIRILQVFARMDRGGAETMIMNYYRAMDRFKVQFDFVVNTTDRCAFDDEIEQLGGQIFRLSRLNGLNIVHYLRQWKQFFAEHPEYKIIHIHFFKIAGVILPLAKRCGITVRIVHIHTANPHYSFSRKWVGKLLQAISNAYTTERFACGDAAGKYYYNGSDFTIINNAIHARSFQYNGELRNLKRAELGLTNQFVIGHVGNFSKAKNHTFLLDVFALVAARNPQAILLLIGKGEPLMRQMQQKAVRLGIAHRVLFLGARADIAELLQAVDLFVFPSLWEGLPVTVIEAQAAGLPVVASNTITTEVNVTNRVENISLQLPHTYWAERIRAYDCSSPRPNTYLQICAAGYDIAENAKWLEHYYIKHLTDNAR